MRKDSELFLKKVLVYSNEIKKYSFELNYRYFKEIPCIDTVLNDIIEDLILNKCLSKKSKITDLEGNIFINLTLDGITYFDKNNLKANTNFPTVNIYSEQVNIANDSGQIEANQQIMYKEKNDEIPNLKIIQNLWSETPGFKLINESNVTLNNFEFPAYLMFIPSKIYFQSKDTSETFSLLTLSPISYELITEQINTGNTIGEISSSKLPANFKAKMGERSIVKGGISEETNELICWIDTYPFLVIICDLKYTYHNKDCRNIIVSTPMGNTCIDEINYNFLLNYVKDNAKYEIHLTCSQQNIYQKTNMIVKDLFANMNDNPTFFCAKKDGYGNVLKLINNIITPNNLLDC